MRHMNEEIDDALLEESDSALASAKASLDDARRDGSVEYEVEVMSDDIEVLDKNNRRKCFVSLLSHPPLLQVLDTHMWYFIASISKSSSFKIAVPAIRRASKKDENGATSASKWKRNQI
jgi:hypothetical protein